MSKSIEILGVEEDGQEEVFGEFVLGKRCRKKHVFGRRCIGAKGHAGYHWCYDELGRYIWWKDKKQLKEENKGQPLGGIASGSIPDGHDNYIRPSQRDHETYLAASTYKRKK